MKNTYILTIALLLVAKTMLTQNIDNSEDHHHHHKNDIGIANSPVYFVNEKEIAYGLHVHYLRNIHETKFGIGLGYERIFDEHKHNTIGIIGSFHPNENLIFTLSPGITFEDEDISIINFALHLEASYNFEINKFHLGPVIGFVYDPEDYHISLGLHIGFGF